MQQVMLLWLFIRRHLAFGRAAVQHFQLPLDRPVRPDHPATMSRARVNTICAAFPGAEVSDPWGGGHDAWKVGGKMFASVGAIQTGVSVKTDSVETAQMLIDAGVGTKAPYFHRSWMHLPDDCAEDELRHRLDSSYRLIRKSLTKRVQDSLPPFP